MSQGAPAQISFDELAARPKPSADATIAYGPASDQFGTLWLPTSAAPRAVVVLVHGGCWLASLPGLTLMDHIAGHLRTHGFAVWNIEYRRLGVAGGGYPGTFRDVAAAIGKLRELAARYSLDMHRVVFVGHSAGGHLAFWAASHKPAIAPRAVIALSGILDLKDFRDRGPGVCGEPATVDRLVGAGTRRGLDVYADTSLAAALPIGVRQIVVTGRLDEIVPPSFGSAYAARARAAGDDVRLVEFPDAGHFELIDPRSHAWRRVETLIASELR